MQPRNGVKMKFNLPKRSSLLRPAQGLSEGSQREALHSIFRRSCEKNRLPVSVVITHVLKPSLDGGSSSVRLANNAMHLISKGEGITSQWIQAMERNVDIRDLWKYTLRDVVSLNGVGMVNCSHWRRWCPQCFEEDLNSDIGPYDRLLWTIEDVEVCVLHKTLLASSCPGCGCSKIPVLSGRDISGFCPRCYSWLGGSGTPLPDSSDQYAQYLLWMGRSFSDLLDSKTLPKYVSLNILEMLKLLRDRHCNGLDINLAKSLGRNKSVIATWFGQKANPSWRALCEISFIFHIPLLDLLSAEKSALGVSLVRNLPLQISNRTRRKRGEKRNISKILALYAAVQDGDATSMNTITDVGRRLGVEPKDLRRILPMETRRLADLLKMRRVVAKEKRATYRKEALEKEVRLLVTGMTRRNEKLTRRAIDKALRLSGLPVQRNEARFISKLVRDNARAIADALDAKASGTCCAAPISGTS